MTFAEMLRKSQEVKNSQVCVGLDTEWEKLPACIAEEQKLDASRQISLIDLLADSPEVVTDMIVSFNEKIVDATAPFASAFKLQIAFFAACGLPGLLALKETIDYIHQNFTGIPVILDAKRGDIGNTAMMYAREIFGYYGADAGTFNPYLGPDTLEPYFAEPYLGQGKGVIVICMTSNPGAEVFQKMEGAPPLYEEVAKVMLDKFGGTGNLGLVVGATRPEYLGYVRNLVGLYIPVLLPGIGAQKGDLQGTIIHNGRGVAIINSSRAIIFASSGKDFDQAAGEAAKKLRDEIREAQRIYNG